MARKEKRAIRAGRNLLFHDTRFQAPMRIGVKQ